LIDPTGKVVQVSGAGQGQGVQDLADETHLNLSVNDQGQLASDDFVGPRTESQQLVEDAIAAPGTVSLDFTTQNNDGWFFATGDGQGGHTIDTSDTSALNSSLNRSGLTVGGVVLHELAEGLAETHNVAPAGIRPH